MNSTLKKIVLLGLTIALAAVGLYSYRSTKDTSNINDQLFAAVDAHDIKSVQQLMAQGADANAQKAFKATSATILEKAIETGEPEIVALLLDNGASVEKKIAYTWSPLTHAIRIALGYSAPATESIAWRTVRNNQRSIIPLLVAKGAQSEYHEIFSAIFSHDMHALQRLTSEAKNDLQKGTLKTDELLQAAVFSINKDIIDYVINNIVGKNVVGKTSKLFQWALEHGDPDTINYMLTYPLTNINDQSGPYGYSALHTAIIYPIGGQTDIKLVEKLLTMGANPNLQDMQGNTPLHIALEWGKGKPVIDLLLKHGADVHVKNHAGASAQDMLA